MKGSKGEIVVNLGSAHNACFLCDKKEKSDTWAGFVDLYYKSALVSKVKASEIAFIEYF